MGVLEDEYLIRLQRKLPSMKDLVCEVEVLQMYHLHFHLLCLKYSLGRRDIYWKNQQISVILLFKLTESLKFLTQNTLDQISLLDFFLFDKVILCFTNGIGAPCTFGMQTPRLEFLPFGL